MAVVLPATNGKADWTNYQDYWREEDAEWIQARTVLRYATSTTRSTDWASPSPGQVTYNEATDQLEYYTKTAPSKWAGVLASQHLTVTPKSSANDTDPAVFGHRGATGGGLQFYPTVSSENKIALTTGSYLDIGVGKIIAKASGLTLHTGAATAVLTTDTDSLASNLKITAPSATLITLTVTGATTLAGGSFSGTLTGGASSSIVANTGTIGSVSLSANMANASSGFVSQAGIFYGSATQARIRQRNTTTPFTLGTAGIDITDTVVSALGTTFDTAAQFKVLASKPIQFYNGTTSASPGTLLGSVGPVVVSAAALTAANYPVGTIWIDT